ncbi:LPXTG cell wall anchor domain-containing protein [Clavibacter sp. VKM Ac-2872]|nr:LPXTG cell wall anchor domain-containing protein [Clavibacter sp. VKM Ac-2872]
MVTPPSDVTVPIDPAPGLTMVKSANPTTVSKVGDTITYSFLFTNTGNTTLTNITVNETEFSGTGTPSAVDYPTRTLAPGESTTATATYVVTQADVDAGKVDNSATGAGTPPGDTPVVVTPPSDVTVPIDPAPGLTMVKSANPTAVSKVGDTITYSFLFTNTGNTTLTNITVNETAFSGTGTPSAVAYPTRTLAPGESTTATATYVVTQADVDAGKVDNSATGAGTPPGDTPVVVTPPSDVTVPIEPAPAITVVKSASPNDAASFTVGQKITYSFVITNTGNTTLMNVTVNETEFSGSGELSEISYPTRTLAPGEQTTATATYTLTQADIDAGKVTNTATSTGTPPGNTPPPTSPPSTVEFPGDPAPSLTTVKTADREQVTAAGQVITYSFLITNTGNVTLTNVTVDEGEFSGTGTLSEISYPTRTLAPGEKTIATATYTVTAADLLNGTLTNTASSSATPPNGPTIESPPSTVQVGVPPIPVVPVVPTVPGVLAFTGSEGTAGILAGGLLLLLLGGVLMVVRRRRQDAS